jgi:hypothetical protein
MMSGGTGKKSWKTVAISVAAGLAGWAGVQFLMNSGSNTLTSKNFEAQFAETEMGRAMKEHFPDDYAASVSELAALADQRSLSAAEMRSRGAAVTAQVRLKYAVYAARAPDQTMKSLIQSYVDFLSTVKAKQGTKICGRVAQGGPMALGDVGPGNPVFTSLDKVGALMLAAMSEGRNARTSRGEPNQFAFEQLIEATVASGVSEAEMAALDDGVGTESDCDALMALYKTSISMPGRAGISVRAFMVKTLASS